MIDHVLVLRHREIKRLASLGNRQAAGNPRRRRSANQVGIESRTVSHIARPRASKTQMRRHRVVRMAGHNQYARLRFAAPRLQFHVIALVEAHLLRRRRADHRRVVPCQFRIRLWQFLQPAVVRKASIENRRVRAEHNLQSAHRTARRFTPKIRSRRY